MAHFDANHNELGTYVLTNAKYRNMISNKAQRHNDLSMITLIDSVMNQPNSDSYMAFGEHIASNNSYREMLIINAVRINNLELVNIMANLKFKMDPNITAHFYSFKQTLLEYAVENAYIDIARVLLEAGAVIDISVSSSLHRYRNALYIAVDRGNVEMVKLLLPYDHKQKKMYLGNYHKSPYAQALKKANIDIIKLFLQYGADPNKFYDNSGRAQLPLISLMDHYDIVELLLEYGADPCAKSSSLESPVQYAKTNGHYDVFIGLVNKYVLPVKGAIDDR